ncbi:MAG TPA: ISAs1 family transposase [Longimicrobium sp.]|nr:ISAs1 family transposase [Longimicrobium sp.]
MEIAKHFASLKDPRVVGRTDHPLLTVLVMALVGVICGANGWDELEEDAEDRQEWYARFLDMPNGVPSADTFRRVLSALRPEAFFECVSSWVQSLAQPLNGQVVAFDGKTLRGAMKRNPWGNLHQVHVWSTKQRLLLAQTATPGAPEEAEAVRQMLALVELRGAIATGDAAHCSAKTAQSVLDAGGDYLLHLKGNRASMHTAVEGYFGQARSEGFGEVKVRHSKTEEKGHGRREIRETWSVPATALDLPGVEWPSLKSVTLIERTRVVDEKWTSERHYYLSSLLPNARIIASAAREHWQIENGLHWVLDVQMGEDACAIRDEAGAQNFGTLRRLALMMVKRELTVKRGVDAKRRKASRNPKYLERILTLGIS